MMEPNKNTRYYAVVDEVGLELCATLRLAKSAAARHGTFTVAEVDVSPADWPRHPESETIVANWCQLSDGKWHREEVTR